jgi:hypothetical protein
MFLDGLYPSAQLLFVTQKYLTSMKTLATGKHFNFFLCSIVVKKGLIRLTPDVNVYNFYKFITEG